MPSRCLEVPPERFESLTRDEQQEIRDTLKQLNKQGRLYQQSEDGGLQRVGSLEAYRTLSFGGPGLFDAIATNTLALSSDTKLDQELYRDHFSGSQVHQMRRNDSKTTEAVQYQTSPIENFTELLWTDLAPEGPRGCPRLSAPGFGVQVLGNRVDSTSQSYGERVETNRLVHRRSASSEESDWMFSR